MSDSPPVSRGLRLAALVSTIVVAAMVGATLFGEHGVARHEKLQVELQELRQLNQDLEAANLRLAAEADALRRDDRFVARTIQHELGWIADDEVVLVFE